MQSIAVYAQTVVHFAQQQNMNYINNIIESTDSRNFDNELSK